MGLINVKKKGFTLIELMVVVIIVGVLAVVSVNYSSNMRDRAILSEAVVTLSVLRNQVDSYYVEMGHYPLTSGEFGESSYYDTSEVLGIYIDDSCLDYEYDATENSYQLVCTYEELGLAGGFTPAPGVDKFRALKTIVMLPGRGQIEYQYD